MNPTLILIYNISNGSHYATSEHCLDLGVPYPKTPDEWAVLAAEAANTPLPPFQVVLENIGACMEARVWVLDKTAQEAWDQCDRTDWMNYLLCSVLSDEAACPLAHALVDRLVAKYVTAYPKDKRVPKYTKEHTLENARALRDLYIGQGLDTPGDRELGVLTSQYTLAFTSPRSVSADIPPEDIRAACPVVPT